MDQANELKRLEAERETMIRELQKMGSDIESLERGFFKDHEKYESDRTGMAFLCFSSFLAQSGLCSFLVFDQQSKLFQSDKTLLEKGEKEYEEKMGIAFHRVGGISSS